MLRIERGSLSLSSRPFVVREPSCTCPFTVSRLFWTGMFDGPMSAFSMIQEEASKRGWPIDGLSLSDSIYLNSSFVVIIPIAERQTGSPPGFESDLAIPNIRVLNLKSISDFPSIEERLGENFRTGWWNLFGWFKPNKVRLQTFQVNQ